MYFPAVFVHAVMQWCILGIGIVAVARALAGGSGRKPWTAADDRLSLAFTAFLDLQLLIGIVLFLYSPITVLGRHELDLTFRSSVLRFFTFVHPTLMIAAVAVAHVARIRIRRSADPVARHRQAALYVGLTLAIILAAIPWPFLPYGRPLLSWGR